MQQGRRRCRVAAAAVAAAAAAQRRPGRPLPTFSASMERLVWRKHPAEASQAKGHGQAEEEAEELEVVVVVVVVQSVTMEASPASLAAPARRRSSPSHRR